MGITGTHSTHKDVQRLTSSNCDLRRDRAAQAGRIGSITTAAAGTHHMHLQRIRVRRDYIRLHGTSVVEPHRGGRRCCSLIRLLAHALHGRGASAGGPFPVRPSVHYIPSGSGLTVSTVPPREVRRTARLPSKCIGRLAVAGARKTEQKVTALRLLILGANEEIF